MIIGRDRELNILKRASEDDKSRFVAIYGRRRIGKTFLVREAFGGRITFQHSGLSVGNLKTQIFAFQESIKEAGGTVNRAKNWMEAFADLKELVRSSKEAKKIIFIDELSWMDTRNSDLIVALENFWNGWASARSDVLLIVCASATSWMMSKVIHNKGGLYNRLTDQIALDSFTLGECEEYVGAMGLKHNREQILEYYMIFGGIPYYWSFLQKGESVKQAVDRILFAENAPLANEYRYLFASIFRNPQDYVTIIDTLAKKKAGMTREEIIAHSGLSNSGELTTKLEDLENCGFIRKFSSFGAIKKNSIYQLMDEFTLFYYHFMEERPTDTRFWSNQLNTPAVNTWCGLAFERVCLRHIEQMKQKLGISGIHTDVNSWYCKPDTNKGLSGSQIDLLIIRKDQVINLCEMKYSHTEYTVTDRLIRSINTRIKDLQVATKTKHAIFPTIITTYGLVDNAYAGDIQAVITMEDLFRV